MKFLAGVIACCTVLLAATCGVAGVAGASPGADAAVDEQVPISPTRTMHLECRGTGSPTVVFISGGLNSAAIWSMPYDFERPTPTVYPMVSKLTRACAYDRPNTASPAPHDGLSLGTSTPVPGAVTPANGVVDLHRMLEAAKVPKPYVLVAHSFGGLIARLYSSTYPKEVAGLVLVDSPSELFFDRLTVAEQEMWVTANSGQEAFPGAESVNFPASFAEIRAARPEPRVPTVLITSDEEFDYSPAVAAGTLPKEYAAFGPRSFAAHVDAQRELAKKLHAKLILDTDSGHYVFVEQPRLVVKAIRGVIREARA